MKNNSSFRAAHAFTLIELLVVIAIIGLLAGMVVGLAHIAGSKPKIAKTQAERDQIITAIESYKAKKGFYPPDNPSNPGTNQLYYELVGTTNNGTVFVTLSGKDSIQSPVMLAQFGVASFNNSSQAAKGSDDFDVQNFHTALKDGQTKIVPPGMRILVAPVEGPVEAPGKPRQQTNSWRYVSSNPTNNPGSFDLWADIVVAGKTNRISNWSKDPIIIGN
jgi:prepilin-type N-terminal cleavage/methylation domain-containing protein